MTEVLCSSCLDSDSKRSRHFVELPDWKLKPTPEMATELYLESQRAPRLTNTRVSLRGNGLTLILIFGVLVRLVLWWVFKFEPINIWDEKDYNALATNLATSGEYKLTPDGILLSTRPPLYPALLAATYKLFGLESFGVVRLLQAALSLVTVVLVFGICCKVCDKRTAKWAAGLLCFYPSLLIYNNLILTEVLFTFLLVLTCYLIVVSLQRNSLLLVGLAGITLGLAALTRSVVWMAPPFLAGFLLITWPGVWSRRLLASASLVVLFAVTIAPWSVRNTRLQQTFVGIDVMGGRNFMMGNYEHTPLYRSWDAIAIEGEKSWVHALLSKHPSDQRRTQGQVDKLAFSQGVEFVRSHPSLTLLRSTVKFFDFWGLEREVIAGAGKGEWGAMDSKSIILLTAIFAGSYALLVLLGIYGVFLAPPRDKRAHWLFLCVMFFVCAVHTVVFGHSRYHLPLIPFVLVYSAGAIVHLPQLWQQRKTLRFALASASCLVLIGGWTWLLIAVDSQKLVDTLRMMN